MQSYDEAVREVRRRYEADPDRYFFCDQYSNEDNWRAHYETTAAEILEQTGGRLTDVIVRVGTGGTLTGLGRRLKEHDPIRSMAWSEYASWALAQEVFPSRRELRPPGSRKPHRRVSGTGPEGAIQAG